jgi:crotonobetainyl-CoA:carnitine CoA-transferase CaiB-like acyl-CoA transferase
VNDAQWGTLIDEMGSPSWARDTRFATAANRRANEDDLDRGVGEYTKNQDRYELMSRLQQRGISACAIQNAADRCERDGQLKARGYFVPLPHSEIGTWPIENFPAKFESMRVEVGGLPGRGAPTMGEDNDYVYRDLLGLKPEEIATLKEEWVI